ncbi:hypothetical protein EG329_001150 [Mollisiaceae sp. DMI_Dod_QoI]|nr:hypothetical protein EG329_001150 [Helotiales sp. DMI_Dod_QoI]
MPNQSLDNRWPADKEGRKENQSDGNANRVRSTVDRNIIEMHDPATHYSDLLHETNFHKEQTALILRASPSTNKPNVPNRGHANTPSGSGTLQVHAGSDPGSDNETKCKFLIPEPSLERYQLEMWICETLEENMTFTERLEKKKKAWPNICHL